jgi:hypothetical protein
MHRTTRRTSAVLLALAAITAGCGSSSPSQVPVGSTVAQAQPTASSNPEGGPPTSNTASQGNSGTSMAVGAGSSAP